MHEGRALFGNHEVLSSGTLILPPDGSARLFPSTTAPLMVELTFAAAMRQPEELPTIDWQFVDTNHLRAVFKGWAPAVTGICTLEPSEIGTLQGRRLFFSVAQYTIGSDDKLNRVISYTFSTTGPVANG